MADHTSIEWTDATWNIITGCSVLTPGCTNCYAMRLAGTRLANHPSRKGLTRAAKAGPVWTGEVRFNAPWLLQPLQWKRPRRIFVCAHGDMFHEDVPDEWIDRIFAVMALAPQHTFQVLTKRSARMRAYFRGGWGWRVMEAKKPMDPEHRPGRGGLLSTAGGALENVWLGVSVEDQKRADERIPDLLATPAAVRWISAEPLLGPLDIRKYIWPVHGWWRPPHRSYAEAKAAGAECGLRRQALVHADSRFLDWVVPGGESGPDARPIHPDWVRSLRDQCTAAGVPFLFKQWGEYGPNVLGVNDSEPLTRLGKKAAGRLLDGRTWDEMPA